MNHKKKLAQNTLIIAIGKMSTQIISYLLLPLFTVRMAVSEYGIYDFICTLSLFLCPFITLLMEESMFRFLIDAKSNSDRKKIITQTILYTFFGIAIFIPISIIYFRLTSKYPNYFIFGFVVFVISNIMLALSNSIARGLSNIKLYSFSNFVLGIVTLLFTILVLLFKPSALWLMWANSVANILAALYVFHKIRMAKYIGAYNGKIMREMIKYSIPLVPNSISWTIINMSDRIILKQLVGDEANGIYAMANKFPNIINVLYGYFNTAWKETAAKIIKEDNKRLYYNSIYRDLKRFLFAVTLLLIAVMPFAFPIFINKQYNDAYVYIPIIMIATYYASMSGFYGGIFTAYKETKIMGTTTAITAIINLIIDLALVKYLDIYAACISTLVADLIVYYYRKVKLNKFIKLEKQQLKGSTFMLIVVLLAYYSKQVNFIGTTAYWVINSITLIVTMFYAYLLNYKMVDKVFLKAKNIKNIKRKNLNKEEQLNNR